MPDTGAGTFREAGVSDLRAVSVFAGIGGFELGLAGAGVPTLASIEISSAARGVLADRIPGPVLFDDVREVRGDQLPPGATVLAGGFPCQDLSLAGRRAGLAGDRSGLFWEFIRLAEEISPRYVIIENVPGLLSSNAGRDMGAVLATLGGLGFRWAYRVLDAQFFGLPQRRRRVFIVASAPDGADPAEVLLEPPGSGGHLAPGRPTRPRTAAHDLVSTLQGGGKRGHRIGAEDAAGGHLIPVAVAALTAWGVGTCGPDDNQAQAGHLIPELAKALCADRGMRFDVNQQTLIPVVGQADAQPDAVRRLTPLECERLQGFPDGWTATSAGKPQSDSMRYRQIGNAVAVPVVAWLARRLASAHANAIEGRHLRVPAAF